MVNPLILNGQTQLFEGRSQYDRFIAVFWGIISSPEHREEFASLGITPADFGTHSIRKGSTTHVATGRTACPPIASICLRANWAMPGVLSWYIKYENAGDQFVGKCASGRSRNKKTFAASPSYWDFSTDGREAKEAHEDHLHSWLRDRLPEQAKQNLKIFAVHKMAVAAIAYHRTYLDEHLHPDSILRSSSIWSNDIPFDDKVVVKHPWDSTDDTPEITGVPLDIVLLVELESMHRKMAALKADLKSSFEATLIKQLDQREVGGSGFARGNEIVDKLETLIEKVSEVSRASQESPGELARSPFDDLPEVGDGGGCVSGDEDDVVIALDEPERMAPNKHSRIVKQHTQEQLSSRTLKVGYHHGRFNPLPASWRYPKGLTIIQLMNLWLIGSKTEHVPPLRKLSHDLIKHFDKKGKTRHKMKIVMGEVEHFARLEGVWLEVCWTEPAVTRMWSTIWPHLEPHLRTQTVKKMAKYLVKRAARAR